MSWQMAVRRKLHEARQGYRIYSQRLWFYPLLFVAIALVFYATTTVLDRRTSVLVDPSSGSSTLFIFTGGADAARSVLGSVATAWTTILGVVFSLTAVVLQLASNKYTSELIPRIRRDSITQMTLSSLVGTVVYGLMVLSTVRTSSGPGGEFVPYIGVTLALVFAGVSLLLTVTFIAHLSRQIQGDFLTSGLAKDGISATQKLAAPLRGGWVRTVEPPEDKPAEAREFTAVAGVRDGYVQRVDWAPLLWALRQFLKRAPEGCSVRVDLEKSVGARLGRGDRLGSVVLDGAGDSDSSEKIGEELAAWIRAVYELSSQRTEQRDVYYALEQLSDTGIKASQTGDVDVVRGCLTALTEFYRAIAGQSVPRTVELHEGGKKIVVSLEYQPIREGALRSLRRFFPQALGMRFDSAVEDFFYDTAGLIEDLTHSYLATRDPVSGDKLEDSAEERASRLAESFDLLLPTLQKLYAQTAGSYKESELLVEGTRRWVEAIKPAVQAGEPRAGALVDFLVRCRDSAQDGPAAGVIDEGLRAFEETARRENHGDLLGVLHAAEASDYD